ncbi:hypothetical protein T492DRAFT_866075 [Pavlovales sp. CCMP2436]|nr:hypothetical protein T492DRAFT_866075 [Pavlovales sp. CCMP2436]
MRLSDAIRISESRREASAAADAAAAAALPKTNYQLFADYARKFIGDTAGDSVAGKGAAELAGLISECWNGTRPILKTIKIGTSRISSNEKLRAHFTKKYDILKTQYDHDVAAHAMRCTVCVGGGGKTPKKQRLTPVPVAPAVPAANKPPKPTPASGGKRPRDEGEPWHFCAKCGSRFPEANYCAKCGTLRGMGPSPAGPLAAKGKGDDIL